MTQRIALVTGGSRGLGKNAALKLADRGTDIIFTYNSQQQAERWMWLLKLSKKAEKLRQYN